jgi:hypothetical protein
MGSERHSMPEQELWIRAREQELFVEPPVAPPATPPVKPFPIYLRETPANPMSSSVNVILWIVGIAVLLLFGVALWRTQRTSRPRRGSGAVKAAALLVAPPFSPQAQIARGCGAGPGAESGSDAAWASDS